MNERRGSPRICASRKEAAECRAQRNKDDLVFAAEAATATFLHHADHAEGHAVEADDFAAGVRDAGEEVVGGRFAQHRDSRLSLIVRCGDKLPDRGIPIADGGVVDGDAIDFDRFFFTWHCDARVALDQRRNLKNVRCFHFVLQRFGIFHCQIRRAF